jgi:hypothetical protein
MCVRVFLRCVVLCVGGGLASGRSSIQGVLPTVQCIHKSVLNQAARHEGVLGERKYSSTHFLPRHYMEVSGQLHAPAALPPGKEPLVPIG